MGVHGCLEETVSLLGEKETSLESDDFTCLRIWMEWSEQRDFY